MVAFRHVHGPPVRSSRQTASHSRDRQDSLGAPVERDPAGRIALAIMVTRTRTGAPHRGTFASPRKAGSATSRVSSNFRHRRRGSVRYPAIERFQRINAVSGGTTRLRTGAFNPRDGHDPQRDRQDLSRRQPVPRRTAPGARPAAVATARTHPSAGPAATASTRPTRRRKQLHWNPSASCRRHHFSSTGGRTRRSPPRYGQYRSAWMLNQPMCVAIDGDYNTGDVVQVSRRDVQHGRLPVSRGPLRSRRPEESFVVQQFVQPGERQMSRPVTIAALPSAVSAMYRQAGGVQRAQRRKHLVQRRSPARRARPDTSNMVESGRRRVRRRMPHADRAQAGISP